MATTLGKFAGWQQERLEKRKRKSDAKTGFY